MRFTIMFNLATVYIVLGDDEYVRKGIDLLSEIKVTSIKRVNEKSPDAAEYLSDSQLASFNIGIAYFLHLKEYEKAIPAFEYAKGMGDCKRLESLTFAAVAAADAHRLEAAKAFLAEINAEESRYPIVRTYLHCYRMLATRHWDSGADLSPCLRLHPDTTLEVVYDINQRLVAMKGLPEEVAGLRSYVKMYEEKIKPEYKKRAARAASNAEIKRLETESRLKDEKIALGERIQKLFILVLLTSLLLLGLMLILLRSRLIIKNQAKTLRLQKQNLQHVLDHIDEGIIGISRDGSIAPVFSSQAVQILGKSPLQMDLREFLGILGLQNDQLAVAFEAIHAILGEEPVAWELNQGLLPRSGIIHGRPFQYFWSAIASHTQITELLISIRDAAASLALEQETKARSRLLSAVKAGSQGQTFLAELPQRLLNFGSSLNNAEAPRLLRQAHTLKGEARGLGLAELQDFFHQFEQSVLQEDFPQAQRLLEEIEALRTDLSAAFDQIRGESSKEPRHPIPSIVQFVLDDARQRLADAGIGFESETSINWIEFTREEVAALRDILVHGVGNAIDHGYLRARQRQLPCDSIAQISIMLKAMPAEILVSIADRGIGIDLQALEAIARKRNWVPQAGEVLTDIVFLDKVSTVDESDISKTAGRGIGMAAVAAAARSLGGTIHFGPNINDRGARIDIRWPRKKPSPAIIAS